jgi:hypothetical protein
MSEQIARLRPSGEAELRVEDLDAAFLSTFRVAGRAAWPPAE